MRFDTSKATIDTNQLLKVWTRHADSNIGVKTGGNTGPVVLNVNNKHGMNGSANLTVLAAEFGGMPETLTMVVDTGEQLFFEALFLDFPNVEVALKSTSTNWADLIRPTIKIADGVEILADGCYARGASSLHISGRRYEWKDLPYNRWLQSRTGCVPD